MDPLEARRRSLYLTAVGALVLWLAYLASDGVVPLLVALILAYVLAPVVAVLERRGISRLAAVSGLFLAFFGTIGMVIGFGLPPLVDQGKTLFRATMGEPVRTLGTLPAEAGDFVDRQPPGTLQALRDMLELQRPGAGDPALWGREDGATSGNFTRKVHEILENEPPEVERSFLEKHRAWKVTRFEGRTVLFDDRNGDDRFQDGYLIRGTLAGANFLRDRFRSVEAAAAFEDVGIDAVPTLTRSMAMQTSTIARGAIGVLGTTFKVLGWLLIVPLYTAFFLMHLEDVWKAFVSHIPGTHREKTLRVLHDVHRMLMGFFRGRMLTMLLKGIMASVGLLLVGAPYWPVFGFLVGLLTIVPAVGPLLAGVPPIMLAYSESGSTTATMTAVVLLVVEVVEGYILIPQLVGREVGLHPLAVVAAILVGTALLGVLGLVLAIPMAAAAKIVWREFVLPELQAKAAEQDRSAEPATPETPA